MSEDELNDSMKDNEGTTTKTDETTKTDSNYEKQVTKKETSSFSLFLVFSIVGILLGLIFQEIRHIEVKRNIEIKEIVRTKTYCIQPPHYANLSKTLTLRHVHSVMKRIGYELVNNDSEWDLLWAHTYPFSFLPQALKPHQKVNHYPGTGYLLSKVDLATSKLNCTPKAFRLPSSREEFEKYASENEGAMFLEKNNDHRGVMLKNVSDIDFGGKKFVQEYVQRPLLVDGHRFDIGIYVAVTSVDPLRAYWYKGDVLFRYCPEPYHPFDPLILAKYVVSDVYMPTWEVPALARYTSALGYGLRDSFDIYMTEQGKDPSIIWAGVTAAINEALLANEKHIVSAVKKYNNAENFFEMMRFDLIVDEDLKVYLLEANMSPNLSAEKWATNQLLYEQLLYSLFSLSGVSNPDVGYNSSEYLEQTAAQEMVSTIKNINVFGNACIGNCSINCKAAPECGLCSFCLNNKMRRSLNQAYREHLHRADFRRLFPPTMKPNAPLEEDKLKHLTEMNRLMYLWYQGKCNNDITFCT